MQNSYYKEDPFPPNNVINVHMYKRITIPLCNLLLIIFSNVNKNELIVFSNVRETLYGWNPKEKLHYVDQRSNEGIF